MKNKPRTGAMAKDCRGKADTSSEEEGAIAVSACLLGRKCRFDGGDKLMPELASLLESRKLIALCPEEMGGLGIPRPACNLSGGGGADVIDGRAKVVDTAGRDRTPEFLRGARIALEQCVSAGVTEAILKDRSPSCGVRQVYRDGRPTAGEGVFAAMLRRRNISIRDEHSAITRGRGR